MLNVVAGAAVLMALVVFAVCRKQKLRGGIFISYRRGVASAYAGRLAEALEARFGRRVFIDIDGLPAGEDFVTGIDAAVRTSSVILVVTHEGWVDYRNAEGARALDDPDDFVRLEIAAALSAGIRIVPLLMNGAAMPREDRLPADIAPLARRQALVIRDADWPYYIEKLTKAIAPSLPKRRWVPVAIATALAAIAAVAAGMSYSLRRATPETSRTANESSGTSTAIVKDRRFHSGEGMYVITSSRSDERSWENAEAQNSYFTQYLIEVMQSRGGLATIKEIYESLSNTVPAAVRIGKAASQRPQIYPANAAGDLRTGVLTMADAPLAERASSGLVREKHALVIGMGRFRDPSLPQLRFAAKDARDFAAVLTRRGRFRPGNVTLLIDERATRTGILTELQALFLRAEPDDLVVIYVSTHGTPARAEQGLAGVGHFITYDSSLRTHWLDAIEYRDFAEKVSLIRARRKVVFLDTAFAGLAVQGGR
jgi:hypothetical protein